MNILKLQPYHRIVETEEGRFLRFEMRNPNIATLLHLIHGSLMIVEWMDRDAGVFREIGLVEKHYSDEQRRGAIRKVIKADSPGAIAEVRQIVADQRRQVSDETAAAQEQADRHLEIREYLRRKAGDHLRDHPLWLTM